MISFTQQNLHKSSHATSLLGQAMEGTNNSIFFVTEPYTINNKLTGLPRGITAIYDRRLGKNDPPPRAAILASRDTITNSMDSWCNRDCAVAIVKIQGKQTLLASIYLDIKLPVNQSWMKNLTVMAEQKKLPILIAMDSNAHSDLFGPTTNTRGEHLEDFILTHGLIVENVGLAPTFELMRGDKYIATHIDVTLSRDLEFSLDNWAVDRSYNGSDHNTIRFVATNPERLKRKIRPWNKADWSTFTHFLTQANYSPRSHEYEKTR